MKYFEYFYLAIAVLLAMILMQRFKDQPTLQNAMLIIGIVLCSFMFSFRRARRQRAENTKDTHPDSRQ